MVAEVTTASHPSAGHNRALAKSAPNRRGSRVESFSCCQPPSRSADLPLWLPLPLAGAGVVTTQRRVARRIGLPADGASGPTSKEAVGRERQVVPQQWLCHTRAPGSDDRRRLDLVIYGASPLRDAMCWWAGAGMTPPYHCCKRKGV